MMKADWNLDEKGKVNISKRGSKIGFKFHLQLNPTEFSLTS